MKHIIMVKFKDDIDNIDEIVDEIEVLFEKSTSIQGVNKVEVHQNIIHLPKRYDLMIEINMEKNSLLDFDNSDIHHIWKEKYGKYLSSKVIFDY